MLDLGDTNSKYQKSILQKNTFFRRYQVAIAEECPSEKNTFFGSYQDMREKSHHNIITKFSESDSPPWQVAKVGGGRRGEALGSAEPVVPERTNRAIRHAHTPIGPDAETAGLYITTAAYLSVFIVWRPGMGAFL